jgi:hypothetical protein
MGWIFGGRSKENGGARCAGLGDARFFVLRRAAEIQKVTPRQKTRKSGFWVGENACEIFHKLSCIETACLTSSKRFHFRRMQIADSKNVRSTENP